MGGSDDTLDAEPEGAGPILVGQLPEGTVIEDRYRIVDLIGGGSMGLVYRAHDADLARDVAIKVVSMELVKNRRAVDRFRAEARAMAQVRHLNVVAIHAFGEHDGAPFFAMELVDGEDLSIWLEARALPLPIPEAVAIVRQIGAGVQAIHDSGATHGDLKPSNVIVASSGRMVVTDLGLTRILDRTGVGQTLDLAGTPEYMAPEVLAMERVSADLIVRVDVYSLAVVAYELLTGQPPFRSENHVELMNMHATMTPPAPSSLRPELGKIGDEVLLAALEKDPRLRTPSVTRLREGLAHVATDAEQGGRQLRIAVVDDDADFAALVRATLELEFPRAEVVIYGSAEQALEGMLASPPSAALVDLSLPGDSGLELIAALRGTLPARLPIGVVTGTGGAKDWSVLRSMGAEAFLVKPVEPQQIAQTVRRLLGRTSIPPPS